MLLPLDQILTGHALALLRELPDNIIDCVVTSPPYKGLRDYGCTEQIGTEDTVATYIERLMAVLSEVRRVLKPSGTCWLNLGDTYAGKGEGQIKPKDLCLIPFRVAIALQDDGWYVRSDIVWHKPNCMPESVKDRPTKAHEYLFLLTKTDRYFYDADAIREPLAASTISDKRNGSGRHIHEAGRTKYTATYAPSLPSWYRAKTFVDPRRGRNCRSVWSLTTKSYKGAHFAVFPLDLPERCLLAGCPVGGVVLDPFMGAGTTALAAIRHQRHFLGFELNPEFVRLAEDRLDAYRRDQTQQTPKAA